MMEHELTEFQGLFSINCALCPSRRRLWHALSFDNIVRKATRFAHSFSCRATSLSLLSLSGLLFSVLFFYRARQSAAKLRAETKKNSPSPPFRSRLYKHALESIFSHLNLSELARISATCRDWSAAVSSMRPIGAQAVETAARPLQLHTMCKSRLMVRHVSEFRCNWKKNRRVGAGKYLCHHRAKQVTDNGVFNRQ